MTNELAIIRRRLVAQGLAGPPAASVGAAVAHLGAVQAQEFAETTWALSERSGGPTEAEVEAAIDRGDVQRTHVMRPTWHVVAREDARWLLRLTKPRVHAASAFMYRKLELDAETFAAAHAVFAGALADGPLIRTELADALHAAGVAADGLRLGYLLMHAELEEVIGSGPRRGRQHTYALLDDRVPPAPALDRDRALAELGRRFFASHGPARVHDLAKWATLTVADARAAAAGLPDHDGWIGGPAAPSRSARARGAFLLGMYDELTVGYKDVRVVLAHPADGRLKRAILVDGRTVGSWSRERTARAATLHVTWFGGPEDLDPVLGRLERFWGVPVSVRSG